MCNSLRHVFSEIKAMQDSYISAGLEVNELIYKYDGTQRVFIIYCPLFQRRGVYKKEKSMPTFPNFYHEKLSFFQVLSAI